MFQCFISRCVSLLRQTTPPSPLGMNREFLTGIPFHLSLLIVFLCSFWMRKLLKSEYPKYFQKDIFFADVVTFQTRVKTSVLGSIL